MPTTWLMPPLRPLSSVATASHVQLPFDAREEVVDVVALEDPLAQRLQHLALLRRRRIRGQRVPPRREVRQLSLVGRALRLDRRPRTRQPRLQSIRRGARGALLADLVELFV